MVKQISVLISVLFFAFLTGASAQCLSGNCSQGSGILIYPSGVRYVGEFRNSLREGWGICIFLDGRKYEGAWSNDHPDGAGIMTFPDGRQQKGYWKRGTLEREDTGLALQNDGRIKALTSDCISGNCANGNGIFLYPNGDLYVGDFVNGKREGSGVCYYANRDQYKGRWRADFRDGRGTMVFADGSARNGFWQRGEPVNSEETVRTDVVAQNGPPRAPVQARCLAGNCQNGYGVYIFQDSSKYTGYFKNSLPDGTGTIHYPGGERYEGTVKAGKVNGEGTLIYKDGRQIAGIWQDGKFMQSLALDLVRSEPNQPEPAHSTKVWAVVVGVAAYSHLPALRYTDDDAYRIYGFLKSPEGGAIPDEQIRILIDEAATRSNILSAMKEVFFKAGPDDLVIMYFSGHGLPGQFLPIDYNGAENEITHEEINSVLRSSSARFKLFIADACHSGGMITSRGDGSESIIKEYYAGLAKADPGTALIMSSKSQETSLEASGLRQGVFSYYLIRGMKGEADSNKDMLVSVQELYEFVYHHVRQYTRNMQSPVIQGTYDPNMPVSAYR